MNCGHQMPEFEERLEGGCIVCWHDRAEKAESAFKEERTEWVSVARLEAAVDILNRIASHKIDTTDCADVTGSEEPIECVAEWVAERMIDFQNARDEAESTLEEQVKKSNLMAQDALCLRKERDSFEREKGDLEIALHRLQGKYDATMADCHEAEAAAAEMRERIAFLRCCCNSGELLNADDQASILHALSSTCGVGWLSPEKKKVMVEAIQFYLNKYGGTVEEPCPCLVCEKFKEALAAVERNL